MLNCRNGQFVGVPHAITSAINPGIQVKDSLDAANIHKAIVDLVADALTPKDMDQLVHRFTNSDQKRIENSSTYKQNDGKLLDDCVGRINNDWKKAYGHDFSIKETSVFKPDFYSIEQSTAGADKELDVADSRGGPEIGRGPQPTAR